jgi:filamentous hemagglutinin family protein
LRAVFSGVLCAIVCWTSTPVALAGDILRGGAPAGLPSSGAVNGALNGANADAAARAGANAADALARTTQALQAVRAMQVSARAIAAGRNNLGADPNHSGRQLPNVPNGLNTGGLVPDSGLAKGGAANAVTTWVNAQTPVQTTSGGRTTVTIRQTGAEALLNWQTFNIGSDTTLNFNQNAGGPDKSKWIAFNKITDPSGVPSQILGDINAPGQVYVINQNGIIFGGASQINTHALVASSLPINDNLIAQGLLNNPDAQFLFSALDLPAGTKGTPVFTPDDPLTPDGRIGDVTVQAGAKNHRAHHGGSRRRTRCADRRECEKRRQHLDT